MAKGREKAPQTVGDLVGAKYNPRKHTPEELEALRRAMAEFGDLGGIVFNRRTGNLIGGHQRRTHLPDDALIHVDGDRARRPNAQGTVAVGWIVVDGERWQYREVDVSPAREKAMNLAANRFGEGAWDYELLPDVLAGIGGELDLDLTGFTVPELEKIGVLEPDPLSLDPGAGRYQEQYGVIVVCDDEPHQAEVYERLRELGVGREIRVVVT